MFKTRIREFREAAGYNTQASFAKAFGIAQSTVGGWEAGVREPNFDTLIHLAKFFDTTTDALLGICPIPPYDCIRQIRKDIIMYSPKEIGDRIKLRRDELDMTLDEVAAKVGVSKSTIQRYENGLIGRIKIPVIESIADALFVSPGWLVGPSKEKTAVPDVLHPAPSPAPADPEISSVLHRLNQTGRDAWMKYGRYLADQPEYAAPAQPEEPVLNLPKATRRRDGFTEIRVFDQPAAAGLGNYLDEPDFHVEQFPPGFIPAGADFGIRISGNSMEPEIPDGITVFVRSAPSIDPGRIGIFVLNGEAYCKKLIVDKTQRQLRLVSLNPAYQDIIVSESDVCRTVGQVIGKMM